MRRAATRLPLLLLSAAALALGACGTSGDDAAPVDGTAGAAGLVPPRWVLVAGDLGLPGADQVVAWLDFAEDGRVTGDDGCNRLAGSYTVAGGTLRFGPLAGTRRACPGAAGAVAREVGERLPRVRRHAIEGRTLTLRDGAGTTLLTYRASTPSVTGAWEVVSILFDDAIRGVLERHRPTADFTAAGRVRGTTGCNDFAGRYEAAGERITVDPGAVTERACADAEAARQERGYLEALRSVRRFDQAGPELTLYDARDRMAVVLRRAG